MLFHTSKHLLALSCITFVSVAFYYWKKHKEHGVVRKEIHEVIMFSYGDTKLKKSKYSRCVITSSMDRLLYHLNSTKQNLDICMYVLTNQDITNILIKLLYKGVKIRVIIDADMAFSSGSTTKKLEKQGVPVRWMKSTNLMHHKFCLLDTLTDNENVTPVVMLGSLNWTNQALNGNWEDVAVTSQPQLVEYYKAEFEKLWMQFKPIVKV